MANIECSSCENLRQNAPDFIINGFSDDHCENLADNTGIGGNSDNCTDVSDLNDCLIGFMENEVNTYDTCDWKKFMKKFIPNIWTTFKAIICWLCGIQCSVKTITNGVRFVISEDNEDSNTSYIVAGKGISFLGTGTGQHETQVTLRYIGGALLSVNGSLLFSKEDFTDVEKCWNFDNGTAIRQTKARKGNTIWHNTSGTIESMVSGGELLYEIRINLTQYPFIEQIYSGIGSPTGGGAYQVNLAVFHEGEYAFGQHGNCDEDTGQGASGHDDGHKVPKGWMYIQARMANIGVLNADGEHHYSPRGFMGIRINTGEIEC